MKPGKNNFILLSILFILISLNCYPQKDSIRVIITYNYGLENGKRTGSKTVINQKTYTLEGKLLRELKLDQNTGVINTYVVYFYNDNDMLLSEEEFNMKDSLVSGTKYSYDAQGRLTEIRYYGSSSATVPQMEKREVINYLNDTLKKSVIAYSPNKKKLCTVKYKYDTQNSKVQIESAYKVPENGISKITEIQTVENGKLKDTQKSIRFANGSTSAEKREFEYNDKNLLVAVKVLNGEEVVSVTNYKYFANNQLQVIEVTGADGIVLSYKTVDYKFNYINLGSNKSYLK
ncbi:MAG: hypothetical protein JXB00_00865 [Bacteroidales bacterium]|nr:hypothetical protein [Bacteroidales bacterium]